jgi:hypothetical protein
MSDWFLSVVGWDYLTPQGIRFGIASFLALSILSPSRPYGHAEVVFHTILTAIAAVLIAQALSLPAGH